MSNKKLGVNIIFRTLQLLQKSGAANCRNKRTVVCSVAAVKNRVVKRAEPNFRVGQETPARAFDRAATRHLSKFYIKNQCKHNFSLGRSLTNA